jgi:hypothetical protein
MKRTSHLFLLIATAMALLLACSDSKDTPQQRVNEALLETQSELSEKVAKAIGENVEASSALVSCKKYAVKEVQCIKVKVSAARSAALLHGLKEQRAVLYKIMETGVIPADEQ